MADNKGKRGFVHVILESSCNTIEVQYDLMNQGDLLFRDFGGGIEENLTEKVSRIFKNSMLATYIEKR
jgi:hypothetical protein